MSTPLLKAVWPLSQTHTHQQHPQWTTPLRCSHQTGFVAKGRGRTLLGVGWGSSFRWLLIQPGQIMWDPRSDRSNSLHRHHHIRRGTLRVHILLLPSYPSSSSYSNSRVKLVVGIHFPSPSNVIDTCALLAWKTLSAVEGNVCKAGPTGSAELVSYAIGCGIHVVSVLNGVLLAMKGPG